MGTEVIMPKLGDTMAEGTVTRWVKKEGEEVRKGEVLLEVTTDKATIEVESVASGCLRKIYVQEGQSVPVTEMIAFIGGKDEPVPERKPSVVEVSRGETPAAAVHEPPVVPGKAPTGERILASPLARRLAEEKGIDLARVRGTGPGGRITREDVLAAAAHGQPAAPASAAGLEPLSPMRKAIAEKMTQSKREVPHYYVQVEVDVTELEAGRKKANAAVPAGKTRISFTHLLVKATAMAISEFPALRKQWAGSGLRASEAVAIGLAVALDDGLIVPVLKGVDRMNLEELTSAADQLVEKARNKRLSADEFTGGTVTISNLGLTGIDSFMPIINTPEPAIIGVGVIAERPWVVSGKVVPRKTVNLTVSADHRVLDGVMAAKFLARLKAIVEDARLLLPV